MHTFLDAQIKWAEARFQRATLLYDRAESIKAQTDVVSFLTKKLDTTRQRQQAGQIAQEEVNRVETELLKAKETLNLYGKE